MWSPVEASAKSSITQYFENSLLNGCLIICATSFRSEGSLWTICNRELASLRFFKCVCVSVRASMRLEQDSTCNKGITSKDAPKGGGTSGGTIFTASKETKEVIVKNSNFMNTITHFKIDFYIL